MSHSNPSHGERKKARALAAQHNISYVQALRRVRSALPPQPSSGETDLLERAETWLEGDPGNKLRELIEVGINGNTAVRMDEFTPYDLVEGHIEQALLETFTADRDHELQLEDAHPEDGGVGVHLKMLGEGDVDWHVSAPTGGDVEAFGDSVEGYEDGGGMLQDWDGAVPVELSVFAIFDVDTLEWVTAEIHYAGMPQKEMAERRRRHSDEEYRRLQALGIEPTDDETQALADAYEAAHPHDTGDASSSA